MIRRQCGEGRQGRDGVGKSRKEEKTGGKGVKKEKKN